jgi:hypothetical protein
MKLKLEEVEGDADRYHALYRDERAKLRRITDQYDAARKHTHVLYEELRAAKNELDAARETEQLDDPWQDGPFELIGTPSSGEQVFPAKGDTLSVADVVQIVEALNEEICQVAVFLGQVLVYGASADGPGTDRLTATSEEVGGILMSEKLANVLAEESKNERRPQGAINPLLVQIVMQVAMTSWCYHAGSKWTALNHTTQTHTQEEAQEQKQETSSTWDYWRPDSEDHDWFIAEMYDRICDHGESVHLPREPQRD